ncbi:MAG: hypothetical protein JNM99_19165 [Verrucomicrobiaceae bacterium]|nr:hypothetical protein [Verrucomicrobiaceae bacterium]
MISRYNRSQLILGSVALVGGLFCFFLAYLFFRYVPGFISKSFGYPLSPMMAQLVAGLGLLAVAFSGYRTWKNKGGLQSYHESAFYHDLSAADTGGAYFTEHYLQRVTGPAYVISQTFLAGPLWVLKAWTLFSSRIPASKELEERLEKVLAALKAADKWQSITDHPEHRTEVLYLAQMGLIDFSAHKGTPRMKAR